MQKEIARRVMKTQWVQDRLQEDWIREMVEDWVIDSLRRSLKPEGKPRWDDFSNKLKKGEEIAISEYIDMLLGFDLTSGIKGLENLTTKKNKPILLVGNHINTGPIRGGWEHAVISYHVKQTTGKEIRWLQGFDPTTAQNVFLERLSKCTNSIPVRAINRSDLVRTALLLNQAIDNQDSLGLYPEGDGSKNLRRGMPQAGRLIASCARDGIDIVTASARFQSDTFSLTFDKLDRKEIERLDSKGIDRANRDTAWQNVADYAMRRIAVNLPKNQRGYYL